MFPLLRDSHQSKQGQVWVSTEEELLAPQGLRGTTDQTLNKELAAAE